MIFRKSFTALLIVALLFQNFLFLSPEVHALDSNGTSNVNLFLTPTLPSSTIIGKNFTLDLALQNLSSSEGDAYRPGFILSLPSGVSLVSAGVLGTPTRTVNHASGSTLVFFQTKNDVILDGLTTHYPIVLTSSNAAGVFIDKNIGVLAYADDSIYGRGPAPTGAPGGTLSGGVDWASGSGVSMSDPTDLTFPNAVTAGTNLSTLPFIKPITQFTPFDVTKTEGTMNLIGKPVTTTLTVHGNSMGTLRHFHLQDIIPMNRSFSGFITSTGVNIGGMYVTYNSPSPGLATLDIVDIRVPTGTNTVIQYETIPLAYDILTYSGSTPILDTGSIIPHHDLSANTVSMHTGSLALVGGPYTATTWNDGTSDILVNASSLLPPRTVNAYNRYANMTKTANVSEAVIDQEVTYTINLDTAKNAAFSSNGSGTFITDILPDGMVYSGMVSSTITGSGNPFTFVSAVTDGNGDTVITWRLNSGFIGADARATIVYQARVDGIYEGSGDFQYENTETLINTASFYGTVADGYLSGIWGYTDPSIIDTPVQIDMITATVRAPSPVTRKHLISITTPDNTVYDALTGMPTRVPAGSRLRFAVTMDFPNVNFINPKVIDALPLLAGPNTSAYDFAFQMDPSLKDITNTGVLYNTDDGTTPTSSFNGLSLIGTTYPNAPWIAATPANNLEFSLGNGVGKKTFAILFTVDILPQKPAGGLVSPGLVPLTNFAYSSFNDDTATPNPLPIMDVPFDVNFPYMTASKVASGTTNIEAGKNIDYTITLINTGSSTAYLQNIVDTLPVNMDFITGSIVASGSSTPLPNSGLTQIGTGLMIEFQTGGTAPVRSIVPIDNTGTPGIKENIIVIRYTLRPNSNFLIQGGSTRTNTVAFDYYASSGAVANGVNNLGPVSASANVTVKAPTLSRSIPFSSEGDSTTNNLYVGEEVVYRTIITVPQGTLNLATYTETNNANLTFVSGSVMAYSGLLTFSTGNTFSGSIVPFGTIQNTDTDTATLETIVLETTYRVLKNATAGTNYSDNGTFAYSSTSVASALLVNVRKPTLTLSKTSTPTLGQYGTLINYTVTVSNTSTTAHAYDVSIYDILPAKLEYITGSLLPGSFSGNETGLFVSGLILDILAPSSNRVFTFQARPISTVRPNEILTNSVGGLYDTLDDDASMYEWTGSLSATANFSIYDLGITHTLTATDLADTTSVLMSGSLADVAIGERVTYDTVVSIPESTFTGFTITQSLPVGMKFLSGVLLFDGISSHTLTNITIGPDNSITFSLGDVNNTGIGAGSGITIRTEAVLQNNGANIAGTVKNSNVTVAYGSSSKNVGPASLDVVEPTVSVTKVYAPNSGDAGDILPTTVTVQNIGFVTAYDVVLTDFGANKTTPDAGYSGTILIGTLAPGESRIYTYNSQIDTHVSAGENLTGTASIIYTSYPGSPSEGERTYTAIDTDFINIINSGAVTISRMTPELVTIGESVHYRIAVPVSEGNTATLHLTNTLPTGMMIVPSSIAITTNPAITYSGTIVPQITPDSTVLSVGQTQTVQYHFTDIINSDIDNGNTEYIWIEYDAIVLNSVDTNNANTKTHSVIADYNSAAIVKNAVSLPIQIIEPSLSLSVSNNYTDGYSVGYTFTLTNSGTASAHDIDISTLLPSLVTYTGSLVLINSGNVVNLTRSGDHFLIDTLPVNTGNPLVFSLLGDIDPSASNGSLYTLTGGVTYTSQAGIYTPIISNPFHTERTSIGGVDDYFDLQKTTSFTLALSLLDESIAVTDINGGSGVIGDTFEYTITLTNTGSTPLSGIPVTLDIPTGFTDFVVQSLPAGSTDLSIATGGVNQAGYLSISGITIPVGQSRTIVYRVKALPSVLPGTVIPTLAVVGDSIEGARGGYPSVPVTIDAPRLISSAIETDINGGLLYVGEDIHHLFTLTNTGTLPATQVYVILAWNTGSLFTGAITFQTGTYIDTGSVSIDSMNNRITFLIPHLPVGAGEQIGFDSRVVGPIGVSIGSEIQAEAFEGISTNTLSNILTPVDRTSPRSSGGGGGGSSSAPSPIIVKKENPTPPSEPIVSVVKKPTLPVKKNLSGTVLEKNKNLTDTYNDYLAKIARYQLLSQEEVASGTLNIRYPKILPQTGKTILERVKKYINPKLSADVPNFLIGDSTLSSYLKNLPEIDRSRDEYIVLPSNGMITPINTLASGSTDYTKLVNGREIGVNTYLKDGVLLYPGTQTGDYGSIGNTVIFGHSSYYASDDGRYKTHFQKIIELESGEEIWVFKKQNTGEYKKYRYRVEASYDTRSDDVSILAPGVGKNLTLFTCTPIGGISGRWIVKAKFIDEEKMQLEKILYGRGISPSVQSELSTFFASLKKESLQNQAQLLEKKHASLLPTVHQESSQYLIYKISKAYHTLSQK